MFTTLQPSQTTPLDRLPWARCGPRWGCRCCAKVKLLGRSVLARQRVEPFTDRQIELVSTFADQAVIAIENTRLITEQREALERQTATAEVLQVINSSPGDLVPVFDTMLERALHLCESAFGVLATYDGEVFHHVAVRGVTPELADFMRKPLSPVPGMALHRVLEGEDVVHTVDIVDDDAYQRGIPARRMLADLGGARTQLLVALRKDDVLLGVLNIFRQEVRPFSDRQVALLQNFAAQAVIAMENARLLTEQREALEQQTATSEVLQVINASPGNLAPVFDAMLERAMRLCGAAFGSLYTYDGERFHSAAQRGVPPAYAAYRAENPPLLSTPGGAPAVLLETRRPVHVLDVRAQHTNWPDIPNARAMVELGGIRTSLAVPLIKDDAFLGFISIYRQEVCAFSDKQIALLQNFAAQAVIAMENARLLTETREALEQQTATAEVLQVINGSPGNLAPVFNAILECAHRVCDADGGVHYTYDGTHVRVTAVHGYPSDHAAGMLARAPYPPPNALVQQMIATGRFIQVEDAQAARERLGLSYAQDLAVSGMRTAAAIPLLKDGRLIGYITAWRRDVRLFSDKQIALLENFAAQAVIAMENARLITETREALEQQTATAEVLGVINASPGNLTPVFEAMLDKAVRLSGSSFGLLATYDGEYTHAVAMRGASKQFAEAWREPIRPMPGGAFYRLVQGEDVVHQADATEDEAYRFGVPGRIAVVDLAGGRSQLLVALRKKGVLLGAFNIYRKEVRPFTDKQIALLRNFAAQAVIAMENARLLGELRQRTDDLQESLEYQTATSDVLKAISQSQFDLQPVLEALVATAAQLCGAEMVTICRREEEGFRVMASLGLPAEFVADARLQGVIQFTTRTVLGRAIRERRAVQVPDASAEPDYTGVSVKVGKVRTSLGVPLLREGEVIGVLGLARQRVEPFTDRQIELVSTFADQAVIAMENARLVTEQREALEQQTATAEVLQVINASPGNLQPVFDAMLEKAMRLCDAAFGGLYLHNGEQLLMVASRGVPAAFAAYRAQNPPTSTAPGGRGARVFETKQSLHILDALTELVLPERRRWRTHLH